MQKRLSIVDSMNLNDIVSSSNLQIGDSVRLAPRSRALAAQKEYPIYSGKEGNLAPFAAFSQPIPKVKETANVNMTIHNKVPVIKVGHIRIIGTAASSILHIGSTQFIDSEARVQHFRHFFFPPAGYETHR